MNSRYIYIGSVLIGIIISIIAGLFILQEKRDQAKEIVGFGSTNGSCNEKESIFMGNETIRNSIKTIEENAKEKARCFANETNYAFMVPLPSGTFWCIDSSGFSGEISHKIESPSCKN